MKEQLKILKDDHQKINDEIYEIVIKHGWGGKYCLSDFRKKQFNHYKGSIGSMIAVQLSFAAHKTVREFEKKNAKKVRYIKENDDYSISGANNKDSIYIKNGMVYFDRKTFMDIKPTRKNDEDYYSEALKHRIKFCRLLSRAIRVLVSLHLNDHHANS